MEYLLSPYETYERFWYPKLKQIDSKMGCNPKTKLKLNSFFSF